MVFTSSAGITKIVSRLIPHDESDSGTNSYHSKKTTARICVFGK
jgi:hypothetical protein